MGDEQMPAPRPNQDGAFDVDEMLSWAAWEEAMSRVRWSEEARAAGLWALQTWREELGGRWPRGWRSLQQIPVEISASSWSFRGLLELVDGALALKRLHDVSGMGKLRGVLAGGARRDQLASPRLQFHTAALASSLNIGVELEPGRRSAPGDLLLDADGAAVSVEAMASLRDDRTLKADRWLRSVDIQLHELGQTYGVRFELTFDGPVDEGASDRLIDDVRRAARLLQAGISLAAPLREGGATITVHPADEDQAGAMRSRLPQVDHWHRLRRGLAKKIEQTEGSGAAWILVDSLDEMWRTTPWSALPLAEQGRRLAAALRSALASAAHLQGVVITDGAALTQWGEDGSDHSMLSEGAIVLRRRLDASRVRRSLIVPLRGDAQAADVWLALYDSEPGWTARELGTHGLASIPELAGYPTASS